MRIDQTKLSKLVVELDSELKCLEAEQHKRALSPEEKERLRRQLQDTRERQRALSQILLRHSLYLDVGRRIFVSTRLERDARPPSWLSIVLERVNELCQLSDQPAFDFLFGRAREAQDFHMAILEKLVDCSCFLVVVPAKGTKTTAQPNVSRFVVEEVGAAFALAKPIVLAVEETISPQVVGKLLGSNWQRVCFSRDTKRQDDFPNKLKQALEEAPREQRESVERRRKIVSRLFR